MYDSRLHLLVTPHQNRKLPVYRWYNYNHSFSRDLVMYIMDKMKATNNDRVLDPFCGSGTTLLASKELGIPSIGLDILPLSVFISNAKVHNYEKSLIESSLSRFKKNHKSSACNRLKAHHKETLKKFFSPRSLSYVISLSEWCKKRKNRQLRYFYLTALLSILEDISYCRKDGGFLRFISKKQHSKFHPLFFAKLEEMLSDLPFLRKVPSVYSQAFEGDARQIYFGDNAFSLIVTSPPYLNRHDYTRVYMLELLTAFIETQNSLKDLRYRTLRSHVEARKKFDNDGYCRPKKLSRILRRLRKEVLPNKQVIQMIEGYFEDMFLVMKECKRVLREKGKIAFVVGDVRYGGIKIPVCDILVDIGNAIDLSLSERITARMRGNSPQQMAAYGKEPSGEYILIWQKK